MPVPAQEAEPRGAGGERERSRAVARRSRDREDEGEAAAEHRRLDAGDAVDPVHEIVELDEPQPQKPGRGAVEERRQRALEDRAPCSVASPAATASPCAREAQRHGEAAHDRRAMTAPPAPPPRASTTSVPPGAARHAMASQPSSSTGTTREAAAARHRHAVRGARDRPVEDARAPRASAAPRRSARRLQRTWRSATPTPHPHSMGRVIGERPAPRNDRGRNCR